eukprot:TRINITY_DN7153_c0_g1_i2.p3 TRINITY_DN7153_c0_g1~~TRINITY_DN7153_c0_g1_i2.p3  ORF type:complete len:115 (-),score=7.03 TRINITY_DN7153_c0_g1_i2:617-961(-)
MYPKSRSPSCASRTRSRLQAEKSKPMSHMARLLSLVKAEILCQVVVHGATHAVVGPLGAMAMSLGFATGHARICGQDEVVRLGKSARCAIFHTQRSVRHRSGARSPGQKHGLNT